MTGTRSGPSSPSSAHHDGGTGALHRTAATLRYKFRALARWFVGSRSPERAPASTAQTTVSSSSSSPPPPPALSLPDELLIEILARLPPRPSSLPRVALVCTRFRRVLSDPSFLRRFRAHHRTPPLLGFIAGSGAPAFVPALGAPDRIPFAPPLRPGESWRPLGCRHGLALFLDVSRAQVVVWDPVTDGQRRVPLPPQLDVNPGQDKYNYTGAVLVDEGHSHAGDRLRSFRLVLVRFNNAQSWRIWAYVYESSSGEWGNVCSTEVFNPCFPDSPVLVGSALCWLVFWSGNAILEFDTDRQSMAVTDIPSYTRSIDVADIQIVRTEDGGLGIALQAKQCVQVWGRRAISHGNVEWELQKTVWRDDLLALKPLEYRRAMKRQKWLSSLLGYDEDTNVIVVATEFGTFMVQLDKIECTELLGDHFSTKCYPYASFYTAVAGGDDGAEILNNA